jgi:hypothetical protein
MKTSIAIRVSAAPILALLVVILSGEGEAAERESWVIRKFMRENVCPVSGPGTCFARGFIVDHRIPICALGNNADEQWNLQWQARAESYKKDVWERRFCRALSRLKATK